MGMNICFVSPHIPPSFGGGGRRIYNIAKYLAKKGYKINIITSTIGNNEKNKNLSINIIKFPKWYRKDFKNKIMNNLILILWQPFIILQLYKYIKKNRFDIMHIVGSKSGISFYSVIIAKIKRIKIVNGTSMYGDDDPLTIRNLSFGRLRFFVHFVLPDMVLNNSPQLLFSCRKEGLPDDKIIMIPNPVNVDIFSPKRIVGENEEIKNSLNIPKGYDVFTTVSLINRRKNIDEIIEIFSEIVKIKKSVYLLIVGKILNHNLEYYNELEKKIKGKGISSNVYFYGESNDVSDLLRASDYFLFSSFNEGMPNAVLEAMSCGLPIIIKRISGVTDFIFKYKNGFEYDTVFEAVQYAVKMLNDNKLKLETSNNARTIAVDKFSYPVIIERYLNLYESLLVEE